MRKVTLTAVLLAATLATAATAQAEDGRPRSSMSTLFTRTAVRVPGYVRQDLGAAQARPKNAPCIELAQANTKSRCATNNAH